jgi:hypothetical protein
LGPQVLCSIAIFGAASRHLPAKIVRLQSPLPAMKKRQAPAKDGFALECEARFPSAEEKQ